MGRIQAVFKADMEETAGGYSVSEWWLQPRTMGPTAHSHPEDHVYFVIAGRLGLQLGDETSEAVGGTYIFIPGGSVHFFENNSSEPAGFISFNVPGGFEARMADIAPALKAESAELLP